MELSFGQRMDNGLIQPWFTHGALDEISNMDLSDKIVWMYGAGLGDVWLAKRCKSLHVVERKEEWIYKAQELAVPNGVDNLFYYHRPCDDCIGMDKEYCEIPIALRPDVIIVDDAYRYECIINALKYRPCTLIVDNWMQDYVFICPSAELALESFEGKIYPQLNHTNHEGNCWKTAIWELK